MITMGGNAEIELIDSMDPFSEGVVLSIMPPKKSWRAIANLSGGEKTLASLALVFALHVFKPTPLYFMVSTTVVCNRQLLICRTRSMLLWISRTSLSWPTTSSKRLQLLNCTSASMVECVGTDVQYRHFAPK